MGNVLLWRISNLPKATSITTFKVFSFAISWQVGIKLFIVWLNWNRSLTDGLLQPKSKLVDILYWGELMITVNQTTHYKPCILRWRFYIENIFLGLVFNYFKVLIDKALWSVVVGYYIRRIFKFRQELMLLFMLIKLILL